MSNSNNKQTYLNRVHKIETLRINRPDNEEGDLFIEIPILLGYDALKAAYKALYKVKELSETVTINNVSEALVGVAMALSKLSEDSDTNEEVDVLLNDMRIYGVIDGEEYNGELVYWGDVFSGNIDLLHQVIKFATEKNFYDFMYSSLYVEDEMLHAKRTERTQHLKVHQLQKSYEEKSRFASDPALTLITNIISNDVIKISYTEAMYELTLQDFIIILDKINFNNDLEFKCNLEEEAEAKRQQSVRK